MKFVYFSIIYFLFCLSSFSQVISESPEMGYEVDETYDIAKDTIELAEIVVSTEKLEEDEKKKLLLLQSRVYRVYPYAKLASERLTSLNKGMERLSSNKEKKKYFKIVEDYLTNSFEARLKKLSRSQGRILVKLIHRQTGSTTYTLIKNLKSGWKAFWSNTAASIFDIDLKSEYEPYESNEDYLIENILSKGFESGRLQYQTPAKPVNIDDLNDFWDAKMKTEEDKKGNP